MLIGMHARHDATLRQQEQHQRRSMNEANRSVGLRGHVYEHVKHLLFTGAYRPGMQIEVEKIASSLDVSRQPVME